MRSIPLLVAVLVFTATSADAASKRDRRRAKRFAKKASKLFQAKRYERALVNFERAYKLVELPALQYNMGQCHLLLGRHQAAVDAFEMFLNDQPDTPYAADVQKLIDEAKEEIERKRPPPVAAAPPMAARPPPPPKAAPPPPVVVQQPVGPNLDDDSPLTSWWLWTIVAGVAVAGGTAIAIASQGDTTTVLPMGDLGVIDRRKP